MDCLDKITHGQHFKDTVTIFTIEVFPFRVFVIQSVCNSNFTSTSCGSNFTTLHLLRRMPVPSTVVPSEHRGVQTERASIPTKKYVQLVYRSRMYRNRSWFVTSQIDRGSTYYVPKRANGDNEQESFNSCNRPGAFFFERNVQTCEKKGVLTFCHLSLL